MPKIPTYDGLQVADKPLNAPEQKDRSSLIAGMSKAPMYNAAAKAIDGVAGYFDKQQEKASLDKITTAEASLLNSITEYQIKSRERKGENAFGLEKDAGEFYSKTVTDISSQLSPIEQEHFNKIAQKRMPAFRGDVMQYEAKERDASLVQGFEAQRQASAVAVANNPMMSAAELASTRRSVLAQSMHFGWDPTTKELEMLKATSGIHLAALSSIEKQSPDLALQYLDANKDEISPEMRDKITLQLQRAATDRKVESINDTYEAQYRNGQITAQQWQDKLRSSHSGDDEKALLQDQTYRVNLVEANKREEVNKAENGVWGLVNKGAGFRDVQRSQEWKSLTDERQRQQFAQYYEVKAEKARAVAERNQAKIDKIEQNNWQIRNAVDEAIADGSISDPSQLQRYDAYFSNDTMNTFTAKIKKRGEINPQDVQKSFEEVKGKKRGKWTESDHAEWTAFQSYIYSTNAELKRPGDVQAWADRWVMGGYGKLDSTFSNDPNTLGEAITSGRKDFVVRTPEHEQASVAAALAVARKAGIKVPNNKMAADEFYGSYYLDAARYFESTGQAASAQGVAAYAILRQQRKPITPANIDYITKQLRK